MFELKRLNVEVSSQVWGYRVNRPRLIGYETNISQRPWQAMLSTTLTSPKENIRSYCPTRGDGLSGDVERSLIMPGAEKIGGE